MSRLLLALVVAVFCLCEVVFSGGQPTLFMLSGFICGAWVVSKIGRLMLKAADLRQSRLPELSLEFFVGAVATNLLIVCIINLAGVSAGRAFLWVGSVVFGLAAYSAYLDFRKAALLRTVFGLDLSETIEVGGIAILCAAVLAWSHNQAEAFVLLRDAKPLPVWIDYFVWADEIAQYARSDGLSRGSIILLGEPAPFYHRATYALPAAVAQFAQIPAFAAATALLLPFSLLACLVGIGILGNVLAKDRFTGLLAALLLIVVPDASFYGLRNGFFGFGWLMFTASGTGWALGICATSFALFCIWLRERGVKVFVLAGFLFIALFWHRAHFFVLYAPALLSFLALSAYTPRMDKVRIAQVIVFMFVGACLTAWLWPDAREYWLKFSTVDEFLLTVHEGMEPTAAGGFYKGLLDRYGLAIAVPAGVLMVLVAAFGFWLCIFPILLLIKYRKYGLEMIDAFPLLSLGVFIALVLFAPGTRHGDITEYQQRVFPWIYALTATYCVVYSSRMLRLSHYLPRVSPFIRAGLTAIVLSAITASLYGRDASKPLFAWATGFYGLVVDASLARTAEFIKSHSNDYDVIAVVPSEPGASLNDIPSQLIALSGVSAFLARAAINSLNNRNEVQERLAILDKISGAVSQEAAYRQLGAQGITWLVAKTGTLAWDAAADQADYRDGAFAVYRVSR